MATQTATAAWTSAFFSLAFPPTPNYNPALDFNNDGRIDIADFGQFSLRFFTTLA